MRKGPMVPKKELSLKEKLGKFWFKEYERTVNIWMICLAVQLSTYENGHYLSTITKFLLFKILRVS